MAISLDGDLWIWGRKNETCSAQNYTSPRIFMQLESASGVPKVKSIAACEGHSLAVTEEGRVSQKGGFGTIQRNRRRRARCLDDREERKREKEEFKRKEKRDGDGEVYISNTEEIDGTWRER